MAFSYRLDRRLGAVWCEGGCDRDISEAVRFLVGLNKDRRIGDHWDLVLNLRTGPRLPAPKEVRLLLEVLRGTRFKGRFAVVTGGGAPHGMVRLAAHLARSWGYRMGAFENLGDALEWMRKGVDALEPVAAAPV